MFFPSLFDFWSTILRHFSKSHFVSPDTSKAFDRIQGKSLTSQHPSFGMSSSLCNLLTGFLLLQQLLASTVQSIISIYSPFSLSIVVFLRVVSDPHCFFYFSFMTFHLSLYLLSYFFSTTFILDFSLKNDPFNNKKLVIQEVATNF